jgi:transposase-like protein
MTKKTKTNYSPEVRERAVRMLHEHRNEYPSQWAAIQSISAKIGCTPETLRRWLRATEKSSVAQEELTTTDRERLKALERENRELRQANEILRKASAYFAQAELDRPLKR